MDEEEVANPITFSAPSLSTLCQEKIALNLSQTIAIDVCKQDLLVLREHVFLIREVSEGVISTYLDEGLVLNDKIMHLFRDTRKSNISAVDLSNSDITDWSLQWLSQHRIRALDISGCKELSVHAIQKYIGRMAPHLQILIMGSRAGLLFRQDEDEDPTSMPADSEATQGQGQSLHKARNLKKLCATELDRNSSKVLTTRVLSHTPNLQALDLSLCDLETVCLGAVATLQHMTSLIIHQTLPRNFDLSNYLPELTLLKNLQHLDISLRREKNTWGEKPLPLPSVSSQNEALQKLLSALTKLQSLDISGTHLAGLEKSERKSESNECAIPGLAGRHFEFLGLINCVDDPCSRPNLPATRVTGDATLEQVLESLRVYQKRDPYCNQSLTNLYNMLRDECALEVAEYPTVLKLVCDVMRRNMNNLDKQVSGSAAMFYLIKCDVNRPALHKYATRKLIRQAARVLYDSLDTHSGNKSMLRNGLLTFCHFELPGDIMEIYTPVIKLLLLIIRQSDISLGDEFLTRISLYLLNNLVRNVESPLKLHVGDQGAVKTMLWLIKSKLDADEQDEILEMAWSTLWNITDETEENCARFLSGEKEGAGLNLFIDCYKKFYLNGAEYNQQSRETLLRNMMGLLGNVSEVQRLRVQFLKPTYLNLFRSLLESTSDGIEVSYHAAGILCHILSDGYDLPMWQQCDQPTNEGQVMGRTSSPSHFPMIDSPSEDSDFSIDVDVSSDEHALTLSSGGFSLAKENILSTLVTAINTWDLKSHRSINYSSLKPILALLQCQHTVEVRHWAVWALCNLTTVYPDKYCVLLKSEKGIEMLQEVMRTHQQQTREVIQLATLTLQNCQKVFNFLHIHIPEVQQV